MEIGTTSQTGLVQAVNSKTASLLEDTYRHPEKAKPIQRFPRLSAEDAAATEDRVAELDATIHRWWTRRSEEGIKAGRAFIELKKILGHGKWEEHFEATFKPRGMSLRTARRWMARARKADAAAENGQVAVFKPATDRGAQGIKDAAQRDEAGVAAALGRKKSTKQTGRYSLPLHLTDDERHAIDALRKLKDWAHAEQQIIRLLRRLCIEYGIVSKDFWRRP